MKRLLIISITLIINYPAFCQTGNTLIASLVNQVSSDSLMSYVRILSGEDSVIIGPDKTIIRHRVSYRNNNLAADYLKQKLSALNLVTSDDIFSASGRNIYSIQPGSIHPDRQFIICAHYDAADDFAADDNATGVAAVLETARILSAQLFPYTLVYAFWDEEEAGLFGSTRFAARARSNNTLIEGVVNLDMLGYDKNSDGKMEIHSENIANSLFLGNLIITVNGQNNLSLKPELYNPGSNESDHYSFWRQNFGAVMVSEGIYGGDLNPFYHLPADRIDQINPSYFAEQGRLALATMATLATTGTASKVHDLSKQEWAFQLTVHTNPVGRDFRLYYQLPVNEYVSIDLMSIQGQVLQNLYAGSQVAGRHNTEFNASDLPPGIYFVRLTTRLGTIMRKILLVK